MAIRGAPKLTFRVPSLYVSPQHGVHGYGDSDFAVLRANTWLVVWRWQAQRATFLLLLPEYPFIFGVSGLRFCGHEHQESSRIRPGGRTISFTSGVRGMRLVAVRCPRRVGAGMMINFCARVVIYGDIKIRSALMRPAPKAHTGLDFRGAYMRIFK